MNELLVDLSGVDKRFGAVSVLNGVHLSVRAGELVGLVGPDGAGKSTLLRVVAGLVRPDAGRALVLGAPASRIDRTRIGYMAQAFGLYDRLTVDENIALYAALHGLSKARRAASEALLHRVDLTGARDRPAGALSGGMRQKLSLLCTLAHDPALLLLDEPAVGLDLVSRSEIWNVLKEQRARGVGVLMSTAYLDEAERCDTVFMLRDGHIVYGGSPQRLSERMRGRMFDLPVAPGTARAALRRAVDLPETTGGVPNGDVLRLSVRAGTSDADMAALAERFASTASAVAPRLEDGFLDMAGGAVSAEPSFIRDYRSLRHDPARPPIVAEGMTKRYGGFTAARDIRFDVRAGEVFGLLGPNGAGKSTVFKMLCGLIVPTHGIGRVDGHDLRRSGHHARQAFGYMAQRFSLYSDLSVRQNLEYFAGCYGLEGASARAAIDRMIDCYHLAPHASQNAGTLPLGFRQRLALACAVIHQPAVLFLDEPTSGVDPILRREFWTHIDGLVGRGVAVLVTTHFMEEAERCDRVTIIHRGRQIATGTPGALKQVAGCPGGTMETAFAALLAASDAERSAA